MRAQRILGHQLNGDLARQARRDAALDVDLRQLLALARVSVLSSSRSRASSAFSVSDCELTETYSPAAIDMAPATSPAMPAISTSRVGAVGGGDAGDEAGGRQDAVVGAEHGRAQPADAADQVMLGMPARSHSWRLLQAVMIWSSRRRRVRPR